MDRFVSNYTLRLDAKGRVSIPAPFRAVLARDGYDGLYCYPTLDRPALDAGGNALLAEIEALIARFPPCSDEREQLAGACRNRRGGELRRPRPQVSDLGARALPRTFRGGHREGARAQEAIGLTEGGARCARSTGMMMGRDTDN